MVVQHFIDGEYELLQASQVDQWERVTCKCKRLRRCRLHPWVGKIPQRKKRQPTPVFLPGKSHGQRSLAGYSPWGSKGSDMTEQLTKICEFSEDVMWSLPGRAVSRIRDQGVSGPRSNAK